MPLRQHDRRIPRDLETIVLKALAKDPKDRFASGGRAGRRTAAVPREPADPVAAGRARRAALAVVQAQPGRWRRPASPRRRCWSILAIGSTIAAWTFHRTACQIQQADRKTRENLFESLIAQAQARRFSRQIGQRFESLDALDQAAAIARELKLPPRPLRPAPR